MKHRNIYSTCASSIILISTVVLGGANASALTSQTMPVINPPAQGSLQATSQNSSGVVGEVDSPYDVGYEAHSDSGSFTADTTEFQIPNFSCTNFKNGGYSQWATGFEDFNGKDKLTNLEVAGVSAGCTPKPYLKAFYQTSLSELHPLPVTVHRGDWVQVVVSYAPGKKSFTYHLADITTHKSRGKNSTCTVVANCNRNETITLQGRVAKTSGQGYYPLLSRTMGFVDNTTTNTNPSNSHALGHDPKVYAIGMTQSSSPDAPVIYVPGRFSKDGKRFSVGPY